MAKTKIVLFKSNIRRDGSCPRLFKGSKRGQNKVHRLTTVGNERTMG